MFQTIINKVKSFFNHAWSIFLARLEIFTGFIIGVVGAIDWSGLASIDFNAGFSNDQLFWFSFGLIIKGVISEIGRRSGTVVTTNDQLVPANIAKKAKIEIKK